MSIKGIRVRYIDFLTLLSMLKSTVGHVHKYEAAFGYGVDILMAVTFLPIVLFQKQNQKMI